MASEPKDPLAAFAALPASEQRRVARFLSEAERRKIGALVSPIAPTPEQDAAGALMRDCSRWLSRRLRRMASFGARGAQMTDASFSVLRRIVDAAGASGGKP